MQESNSSRFNVKGNSEPSFIQGLALGIAIIAAIFAAYLYWSKTQVKTPVTADSAHEQDSASIEARPSTNAETPDINDIFSSDQNKTDATDKQSESESAEAQAREKMTEISSHPIIQAWLATEDMLRKTVSIVDNIAQHKLPKKELGMFEPKGKFLVIEEGKQFLLDPEGYQRYDNITESIASLDAKLSVQIFQNLEPLIQTLYEELGYQNETFRSTLLTAIDNILKIPAIYDPIYLVRPKLYYKFSDPDLESASSITKQFIRMGPVNTMLIQQKLTEISTLLKNTPAKPANAL